MGEIVVVRENKCEGCLYSPNAVASNAKQGRDIIKANPDMRFHCHCNRMHDGADGGESILCRGFFDAHKDRLPSAVRLTKKKGKFWQFWKGKAAGCASFGHVRPVRTDEARK